MKKFIIFLFVLALFTGYCQPAAAQFWKKWFHKEEPRVYKKKKKPVADKPIVKPKKKRELSFPESKIRTRYRVDVLAQLYLNTLIKDDKPTFKGKIPDKAIAGIDFYEGVKLASDTLK